MFKNVSKISLIMLLVGVLTMISCSKDQEESLSNDDENLVEVKQSAALDVVGERIDAIVEEVYAADEIATRTGGARNSDYIPTCVTITTVLQENMIERTLDFGDGCTMPNGHVLSGIIVMRYEKDMTAMTKTISVTFNTFYVDGILIEGGRSIFRERSNASGNPQSTYTVDISATWSDGSQASRVGEKVREWIEGYGSGHWGDNVFLITGNRTTTFRNGAVRSGTIVVPLRREMACRFIVSGVINLQRNNHTAVLDFGEGNCDNQALITMGNGNTHIINLN